MPQNPTTIQDADDPWSPRFGRPITATETAEIKGNLLPLVDLLIRLREGQKRAQGTSQDPSQLREASDESK